MSNDAAAAPPDHLDRWKFLQALETNIDALAKVPGDTLATPRVIAVDALWGNGKTWVARELARRLRTQAPSRKVASIDVFRYDHHDDPFAVIASSIYAELRPSEEKQVKFLRAAGAVLKSAAPVAAKAGLAFGARAIGLDADQASDTLKSAVDSAKNAAAGFSEKAVEKLFESYSDMEKIQNNFMTMLSSVTAELEQPFVVIVDELDRCRPSFALEVLERIKHLFDAENVVFVLFWNSQSIHESIRHTYGQGTDAVSYLAKFVAFNVPLALENQGSSTVGSRFENFVRAVSDVHFPSGAESYGFRLCLTQVCEILDPNLRHIQRAIQLAAQIKLLKNDQWPALSAYLLLLKTMDQARFAKVVSLDPEQVSAEVARFAPHFSKLDSTLQIVHSQLSFAADRRRFDELVRRMKTSNGENFSDLPAEDSRILNDTDHGRRLPRFQQHAAYLFRPLVSVHS